MKNNIKKIEKLTEKYINKKYPNGILVKEFGNIKTQTRPDYALFLRDKIIFFELKGNSDSLTRLDRQVFLYRKIADQLVLILDKKHNSKKALYYNKNGAGILFYKKKKFNKNLEFAKTDPFMVTDIINLLYADELKIILEPFESKFGFLFNQETRIAAIKYIFTQLEIKEIAHNILYNRMRNWDNNGRPDFYGIGELSIRINNLSCKAQMYKEFLVNFTFKKNNKNCLFS